MEHKHWSLCSAATLLALVLLAGCGAGSSRPPTLLLEAGEPSGGRWVPIVLASGNDIPVSAPPAPASQEAQQELQDLRALQAQRTPQDVLSVNSWNRGACTGWNEVARGLIAKYKTNPPQAARVYTLVSVAQYDALVAAWNAKYRYNRPAPSTADPDIAPLVTPSADPAYPSDHAAVAAASATVLKHLFPDESPVLNEMQRQHELSRLLAGVNTRSDITAAAVLGRTVAEQVLRRAQSDGADRVWGGSVRAGPGMWNGTKPLLPLWGTVTPWLVADVAALRPPPPPALDSPEFAAALAEVRQVSDTRTLEQLRIARFWADGPGTTTPPGHWNAIACDLIQQRGLNELRAARTLALLNVALMDASICCWDAKYAYWLIRPSQADPAITLPVGLPNFPAYTSGHSTFSGAASEVLAYLFPDQSASLRAMAQEASVSRLYGGIHYRFDCEAGLSGGRHIGGLAVNRGQHDGSP